MITEKIHGTKRSLLFKCRYSFCRFSYNWKNEYRNHSHVKLETLIPKVGEEKAKEIINK